jgi:aminoglycoside 3-N-acetyltransferase
MQAMTSSLIATTKQYCKTRLRQARRLYAESFHAFSPADLAASLRTLGITGGDTLLVHSSYDAFEGFTGRPTDAITVLKNAVGPDGTLMMPTLPFTGTALEYARSGALFDVRRTPSRMGLLTELFRRSPDVLRSVHPTHSVAVWGRDAPEIVDGHHLATTPCGKNTPFARLLDRRGKIVLMGTDIGVLTFYHMIEELLENELPLSPFTAETFQLQSRDAFGNILATRTRLFEPATSRRRNLYKLVPELQKSNAWQEQRVARLSITALKAADVLMAVSAMSQKGAYCYD